MIYDAWFKNIPGEWIKIGELHLGKKQITTSRSNVTFYATNQNVYAKIKKKIELFIKTLPHDVQFTFTENGS